MKIGINCLPLIPGKIGGMENYFRNLLSHLIQLNNSDQYLLLLNDRNENSFTENEKIRKIIIRSDRQYSRMMKVIETSGLDLYFCPFLTLDPLYVSVPTAVTIPDIQHEFHPELFGREVLTWRKNHFPLTIKNAGLILTLSGYSRRTIVEKYKVSQDKVCDLHLDAGEEHKMSYSPEQIRKIREKYRLPEKFLFYPANTWLHKNHKVLMEALNILKREKSQSYHLLLTGSEDSAHPEIANLIKELDLSDSVQFLGYIDKNELPLIYRAAQFLVFPSLFEGFGIPLLEAMHAGIPIVAANDTSIPEVAGNAAILFDPLNPEELAEKIEMLSKDQTLRDKLIREGVEQLKKFDWRRTAQKTRDCFQKVIEQNRKTQTQPTVSLFVHSFNQKELLEKTVNNILSQNYPHLEICVIDGGSEKEKTIQNDKIRLLFDTENAHYDAVQKAFREGMINGEIVGWMSAGDTFQEGAIAHAVQFFQKNDDLAVVYGDGTFIADDLSCGNRPVNVIQYHYLAEGAFQYQFPVFIRKKIFLNSPLLSCKSENNYDYPYWFQISSQIHIAYHPSVKLNSRLAELIQKKNSEIPLDSEEEKFICYFFRKIKRYYGHFPLSWVPGLIHYRCKGKKHLYFLSKFGLFSGAFDYQPRSIADRVKLIRNKLMIFLFGNYLSLRRLPYTIYRMFFRPEIGTLGKEEKARELKITFNSDKKKNEIHSYPKISIVTPSCNQAGFIEKTMKSVLDQNYPNLEYIVMDGESKDGTPDLIKKYEKKLAFWVSQKDKGQTNALNLGFVHTTGEIMAYLNSDDLLLPGSLEYAARFFAEHSDVDVLYGHRILINTEGLEIGRWILPEHSNDIIKVVDYVPQETLFWRRKIWEKVGGRFDESFHYAMDWDLITRFIQSGAKIVRAPVFLGAFRVHRQQKTTASSDVGENEVEKIREKVLGYVPTGKEINKITRGYVLKARVLELFWKFGFTHFDIE